MRANPPAVTGPTAARSARVFRFAFLEPGSSTSARQRRRLSVFEYLECWVPLRILAEQSHRNRCLLWIETQRAVQAAAAADYVRDCPGYVPKSFRMLG